MLASTVVFVAALGSAQTGPTLADEKKPPARGNFSVSPEVKDIEASNASTRSSVSKSLVANWKKLDRPAKRRCENWLVSSNLGIFTR